MCGAVIRAAQVCYPHPDGPHNNAAAFVFELLWTSLLVQIALNVCTPIRGEDEVQPLTPDFDHTAVPFSAVLRSLLLAMSVCSYTISVCCWLAVTRTYCAACEVSPPAAFPTWPFKCAQEAAPVSHVPTYQGMAIGFTMTAGTYH